MKCPHCGTETPIEKANCVACGQSLSVSAQAVMATTPGADREGSDWGPRLLRYFLGLVALMLVLWLGANFLKGLPLGVQELDQVRLEAPRPKFPTTPPPKTLPQAPLLGASSVALPPVPSVEIAFGSRDQRVRQMFLERNGGDAQTEAAVEKGLKWLASVQNKDDGAWKADAYGGKPDESLGVTGLALLAFLGAGHSHKREGPHQETVAKAIQFVLRQQGAQGLFPGKLYNQGICTMAIVEAYGLTSDTTLEQPARLAVQAIIGAQAECGGWDYGPASPRNRGDTSVTGWQVMALKSARRVGIEVPEDVMTRMRAFLAGITRADGSIGYSNVAEWRSTPALTAAGVNAHLFAGAKHDDDAVQKAVGVLLRNIPIEPKNQGGHWVIAANIYLWYHGSLALSRIGGPEWKVWNERAKAVLLRLQEKEGPMAGSWDPSGDPWATYGGRIYFTALAILALEVYYRYD